MVNISGAFVTAEHVVVSTILACNGGGVSPLARRATLRAHTFGDGVSPLARRATFRALTFGDSFNRTMNNTTVHFGGWHCDEV